MAVLTAAIIGAVAAAGAAYHSSRSSKRLASDQERDQENAIKSENSRLEQEKSAIDKNAEVKAQRARQRALVAGGGYQSTINTSPLGLSTNALGKSKLGE